MVVLGRPIKSLIRSRGNATKPTPAKTMNSSQPACNSALVMMPVRLH